MKNGRASFVTASNKRVRVDALNNMLYETGSPQEFQMTEVCENKIVLTSRYRQFAYFTD